MRVISREDSIFREPSDTIRRAPDVCRGEDMVHREGIDQRNSLTGDDDRYLPVYHSDVILQSD